MLYIQAELMARAIGVTYHIKGIQMLGIENVLETKLYTIFPYNIVHFILK
jgi:hypothetical protein